MEKYLLSWPDFFLSAILLAVVFFVLRLLRYVLKYVRSAGARGKSAENVIQSLLVIYEPLCVVVLAVVFILINPVVHGLLIAFLVLFTFSLIRNYLNGRIFLRVSDIEPGLQIKGSDAQGVVQKIGRLGLEIQTSDGNQFVNYTTLLAEGFTVLKGKRTGSFHQLLVKTPVEEGQPADLQIDRIENKLFNCPYLDWTYKPEIQLVDKQEGEYSVRVLVKKDPHLGHLIELINEWGYACSQQI